MCPSSTSSSSPPGGGWARLRRLGWILLASLIGLELVFRLPITQGLDPYEDLLWFDVYPASYTRALRNGEHHDLWLLGSSYMMTSLNPAWIQTALETAGLGTLTVQNYGLNDVQNLEVMGQLFDRWYFTLDQPTYAVLAIASGNFGIVPREVMRISDSSIENMLIFPDSLEDQVSGFLYRQSALVHYGLLLRYAIDSRNIDQYRARFINHALPLGGYIERDQYYAPDDCDLSGFDAPLDSTLAAPGVQDLRQSPPPQPVAELDTFIQAIQRRGIKLAIVILPDQACDISAVYGPYANYRAMLVDPLVTHLEAQGLPFIDLTLRFEATIPAEDQASYFNDLKHTNVEGAALLSQWTSEFLADWLHESGTASRPDFSETPDTATYRISEESFPLPSNRFSR